jgi:predicted transcriptional regulator
MKRSLPDLSRFEIQCLRRLWSRGEATARDILDDLPEPPSYSTVRKILERLEGKGAVARVRMDGKAVVYRSLVTPSSMIRKEISRLLDTLFDGSATPLVAHLADMRAVTIQDLQELEAQLDHDAGEGPSGDRPAATSVEAEAGAP